MLLSKLKATNKYNMNWTEVPTPPTHKKYALVSVARSELKFTTTKFFLGPLGDIIGPLFMHYLFMYFAFNWYILFTVPIKKEFVNTESTFKFPL